MALERPEFAGFMPFLSYIKHYANLNENDLHLAKFCYTLRLNPQYWCGTQEFWSKQ